MSETPGPAGEPVGFQQRRSEFIGGLGVEPDPFQLAAMDHLDAGRDVLVAAPTSSGKTMVAEYAVVRCLAQGRRCFYTTPIKALSNQKFRDLGRRLGVERVGLLTGDTVIRPDAPVLVMTTEVVRNMIYARSEALEELGAVVLDEVHYLADPYRGAVWEEIIVQIGAEVALVCLSATISNAAEIADWMTEVRDEVGLVVETHRPVPLRLHYLVGDRRSGTIRRLPLLDGRGRLHRRLAQATEAGPGRRRLFTPRRPAIVSQLARDSLLPAIFFVFSRLGCDESARACAEAGLRFTDDDEAERIRELVEAKLAPLDAESRAVLELDPVVERLTRGIASHHAGLIPPLKEAVEELFAAGLIGVVFATETLALGVNLPARSVVIDTLSRYRGDGHEMLTPAELTQLTGRAGRRGIDEVGHAVLIWSRWVSPAQAAELAGSSDHTLRSAFRPTYNMVANLVERHDRQSAHVLLGQSLAQYQIDRELVGLRARRQRLAAQLEADGDDALASRGRPASIEQIEQALAGIEPGDVVEPAEGPPVLVLSRAHRSAGVRLKGVTARAEPRALMGRDFDTGVAIIGRIELTGEYQPNARAFQKRAAASLRRSGLVRRRGASSPRRGRRLADEIAELDRRIDSSQADLVRRLDVIVAELEARGYVADWSLTPRGQILARLFHELDLVMAEALVEGVFDGLEPAELAGVVSCAVYERRGPDEPDEPWFPSPRVAGRVARLVDIAASVARFERRAGLPVSREPDPGFVALAHAWTSGLSAGEVLADDEVPGGDFVRVIRQLIDLLGQLAAVDGGEVGATARRTARLLDRGVIAVSNRVEDPA